MLVQGCLLVSRTLLTDYISRVEGHAGKAITSLVRVTHHRTLPATAAHASLLVTLRHAHLQQVPAAGTVAGNPALVGDRRFREAAASAQRLCWHGSTVSVRPQLLPGSSPLVSVLLLCRSLTNSGVRWSTLHCWAYLQRW